MKRSNARYAPRRFEPGAKAFVARAPAGKGAAALDACLQALGVQDDVDPRSGSS